MNVHTKLEPRFGLGLGLGLALVLALGTAQAQDPDLTLADPPTVEALMAAAQLTEAQARSAREELASHRRVAQQALTEHNLARRKALMNLAGEEALNLYRDFRLKSQAFVPANARYRRNSQQRRMASGEAGGTGAAVNLLTRASVAELRDLEMIDEEQARELLEQLQVYRARREALYAQWDAEKDALLVEADPGLSTSQRAAVIEADRLAVRFWLMAQRRDDMILSVWFFPSRWAGRIIRCFIAAHWRFRFWVRRSYRMVG